MPVLGMDAVFPAQCSLPQTVPVRGAEMLARADDLHRAGDTAAAITHLREVLVRHPTFADAHYNLAVYLRMLVCCCT